MQEQSHRNLEALAERDPVSRPLAVLQLEALRSAGDQGWAAATAACEKLRPFGAIPALHQAEIPVDPHTVNSLVSRLIDRLREADILEDVDAIPALKKLDGQALLQAAMEWDQPAYEELALQAGVELPVVITLGQCASLPLLTACARGVAAEHYEENWDPGYCPVCGSWPVLAEQRGLDRQQWLRCGRCSAGWRSRHQRCVFCDNTDYKKLGYMAPEAERESRRVVTCDVCMNYYKVFASVSPFAIGDILRQDLESLELDIAAIDSEYEKPDRPGFPVDIELVPIESESRSWFPWR